MTSERHLALTRALFATWNDEGIDAVVARFWHPDIDWHDTADMPDSRVHRGRDQAAASLRQTIDAIGHFSIEVHEVKKAGNEVLAALVLKGTSSTGAVPYAAQFWQLLHFSDDRVDRVRVFMDGDAARRAAAG